MKKFLWPVSLFMVCIFVYYFTSPGNTPYDYFTRLSQAFLQGKYWLTQNPPWLSELIPAGAGKFYVVYPPLPAILALPFVAIFGPNFPQQYLGHLIGAGIIVLTYQLSLLIKKSIKLAVWSSLVVGLGSIVWYLSSVGSAWYLDQTAAMFFLLWAIVESLGKKRFYLIGLFLGAAYISRVDTILAAPFIFFMAGGLKKFIPKAFSLLLGFLPFLLFYTYYDFLRYGVFYEQGYFLLPTILHETNQPWFKYGVMNLKYVPDNLKTAFWSFPKVLNQFPYLTPSWAGLSIWITTPAFIYSLLAPLKNKLTRLSWGASLVILSFVSLHGGTGFAQFGYRFAVDFYPLLILLTILGVSKQNGPKWHHWLLLALGIIVNLWGVLWINKFGWVSF